MFDACNINFMYRVLKNQGYGHLQICMLFNIHMKYIMFNTFGYNILKYVTLTLYAY